MRMFWVVCSLFLNLVLANIAVAERPRLTASDKLFMKMSDEQIVKGIESELDILNLTGPKDLNDFFKMTHGSYDNKVITYHIEVAMPYQDYMVRDHSQAYYQFIDRFILCGEARYRQFMARDIKIERHYAMADQRALFKTVMGKSDCQSLWLLYEDEKISETLAIVQKNLPLPFSKEAGLEIQSYELDGMTVNIGMLMAEVGHASDQMINALAPEISAEFQSLLCRFPDYMFAESGYKLNFIFQGEDRRHYFEVPVTYSQCRQNLMLQKIEDIKKMDKYYAIKQQQQQSSQ